MRRSRRWATTLRMLRHTFLAILGLTLAACATQQGNTREVLQRADTRFFVREQCQPKGTASLARDQVTGLDELPGSLRDRVLSDLPLEAIGSRPFMQCQDVAARLLEDRLHALCWPEARVTSQAAPATKAPATNAPAQPRLNVQLGARYQIDAIWVVRARTRRCPRQASPRRRRARSPRTRPARRKRSRTSGRASPSSGRSTGCWSCRAPLSGIRRRCPWSSTSARRLRPLLRRRRSPAR